MYSRNMTVDTWKDFDYRTRSGVYTTPLPTSTIIKRRKAIKRDSGIGSICPGCGLTRSSMNKCECNS
jgi:hypothetical protein